MGRVEEKKQQKKKALMNSAYDLFTTVGFHKTTIMAIALRAGVAKGTFYLWFKDKEDIRNALIIEKSSELLTAALAELEHAPREMSPLDKLIYIVDYVITCLSRDIAL
ncbi:MAG: helix-turn-helix domain containing protein, partial [Hornefia butyriciproducens]|nr:helix-turn-helix domain containing protein [Hornefia butyriciproducens]